MSKKTTLFAITMIAAMPLAFAQTSPTRAEENANQESVSSKPDYTKNIKPETRKAELEERKNNLDSKKAELEEKKAGRLEAMAVKKDELAQKRCEIAQKRISNKSGQLENNQKMYQRVYGNMNSRLTRLVKRLNDAGLDTTKLQAELITLNSMIQKLHTDYAVFLGEFKGTQSAACDKSKDEFKTQFEGVRSQVSLIKADRQAIKDYFNTAIKPELQVLKAELAEQLEEIETEKPTAETDNDDADEKDVDSETKTENQLLQ